MHPGGYEILDHPADMGLSVWASSQKELFIECIRALGSVLVDSETVEARHDKLVNIQARDPEQGLYKLLSELLFLFDAEKFLTAGVTIDDLSFDGGSFQMKIRLSGERFEKGKHQLKTYVKAITYHQLELAEDNGIFRARIFLDI